MTRLEILLDRKAWAERWLAVPAAHLPGTLTHEKAISVLEETEIDLIDFLCLGPDGKMCLYEEEQS